MCSIRCWLCSCALAAANLAQGAALYLVLAIVLGWAAAAAPAAPPDWDSIRRGNDLFEHQWRANDLRASAGDGLGPLFNARSCVECHNQGGIGGSGESRHNVDVLILIPPSGTSNRTAFAAGIKEIHPGFVSGGRVLPNITLHKFGTPLTYKKWRTAVRMLVDHLPEGQVPRRMSFMLVQRSTPALFGAGQIDSISKKVIEDAAAEQARRRNGVHGRVALARGGPGKFGWRGQTATLRDFVMGACANELGLHVTGNPQPANPLDPESQPPGVDLTDDQCDQLVAYVASLPAPTQRLPANDDEEELWTAGERIFRRIGCAECHMRQLGQVAGIYSDLLLHDMGELLADRASANFRESSPGNAYYGGPGDVFVTIPEEAMRLWRTPPLWGVANSAPYLHDGRARTLEDAILLHGGEGELSRDVYRGLNRQAKERLLGFLGSLGPER